MAVEDQHPPATAATETSDSFTEPLEKEISEPKEEHERPLSHSSHSSEDLDAEKQDPNDGTSPAHRTQSQSDTEYPGPKEMAIVMLALILAIFLVALVSLGLSILDALYSQYTGPNNHRHSHSKDYRRVPLSG